MGSSIVSYKDTPTSADTVRGSPVVPGSHKRVLEEGESVMYSILIIKNKYLPGHFEGDVFVPGEFIYIILFCLVLALSSPIQLDILFYFTLYFILFYLFLFIFVLFSCPLFIHFVAISFLVLKKIFPRVHHELLRAPACGLQRDSLCVTRVLLRR